MPIKVTRQARMTRIYLSGSLAKKFFRFKDYLLASGDGWEALRALRATVPGWAEEIARCQRLGMRFAVYRNRENVGSKNSTQMGLRGTSELRIVPVVYGAKRAGVLQTVIGIALIVLAWWNPLGWSAATAMAVGSAGVANTAGGVIQMLSPQAGGLRTSSAPENAPSYAFGSARNTTASGNPVPICIGRRRWGGAIISAAILAEDKA